MTGILLSIMHKSLFLNLPLRFLYLQRAPIFSTLCHVVPGSSDFHKWAHLSDSRLKHLKPYCYHTIKPWLPNAISICVNNVTHFMLVLKSGWRRDVINSQHMKTKKKSSGLLPPARCQDQTTPAMLTQILTPETCALEYITQHHRQRESEDVVVAVTLYRGCVSDGSRSV